VLSSKSFEKEYEQHNKYKDIISKSAILKQKKILSAKKLDCIQKNVYESNVIQEIDEFSFSQNRLSP
jgi:hypothetical protein